MAVGELGDARTVGLDHADVGRALEVHRGRSGRQPALEIGQIEPACFRLGADGNHVDVATHRSRLAIAGDHRLPLRVDHPRHEHLLSTRDPGRHADGVAGSTAP